MEKINELIELVGNDRKYIDTLIKTDQMELLTHEGLNRDNIFDVINQIKEFELIYPDGLLKYLERAKTLLKKSKKKINKYANYIIKQPDNLIKIKFHWRDISFKTTDYNKTSEKLLIQNTYMDNGTFLNTFSNHANEEIFYNDTTFAQNSNCLSEEGNTPETISSNEEYNDMNYYKKSSILINELKELNSRKNVKNLDGINLTEEVTSEKSESSTLSNNSIIELFIHYEKIGLKEIDKVCFILLAGGLGERLNYNDIKLKLKTNLISEKSYIEYYCNHIKTFQNYIKKNKNREVDIPFIIMLSDDTYEKTINFFNENNFFCLKKSQVHFLKQKKVFCLKDNEAHLDFLYENNTFKFSKKPHGHGDIHSLIKKYNILDNLIEEGYKYLYFFQDTNALAIKALFVCLGVSIERQLHMNFLAISRKPGEEIGAICKLISGEKSMSVNLEYNMLESILAYTGEKEVIDENGCSIYPGNTSAILFEIKKYNEILNATNGIVPEFINPKYTDNTREHFKSPTRVESMMQDFALYFNGENHKVGVTELNRFLCFSAVKNDFLNAQKKIENNIHPECMFSGESDLYYSNYAFIELACLYNNKKITLDKIPIKTFNGVQYFLPPKILIEPQFAFTLNDLIKKIKGNITLSNNATLWIKTDAIINNLHVDGTLIIEKHNNEEDSDPIILDENVSIKNKGYEFVHLDNKSENVSNNLKIRGYKLIKKEAFIISN
ncbi:UTP--glucose-1-phosphate uridylyltransferase, putative [Plasmodium gallinaceum]|uniref:UTP-monosaccharide-1-phosphate uridylyltransferase n=1 Tax=Plasmodium gallinaceum TaxID=5849 RepID=A0A1J1H067_PLAGA|nr:UTP--glucose-1-phosphate uridylyltransferase, putative [Plasmodium gallinaceum]CRG97953.1 UTP--glucose-1-phosphate uridylyltransferase, putative [Plasmodium gallinaceum]